MTLQTWHPDDLVCGKVYVFFFVNSEGQLCKDRGKFVGMNGRPLHLWFEVDGFGDLPVLASAITRVE